MSRGSPSSRSSSLGGAPSRSGRRSSTARSPSSRTRPTRRLGCGTSWATTGAGSTRRTSATTSAARSGRWARSSRRRGYPPSSAPRDAYSMRSSGHSDRTRRCAPARTPCSDLRGSTRTGCSRRRCGCSSGSSTSSRRRTRATRPTAGTGSRIALTYDNARLPHALIVGGVALGREDLTQTGLEALRWLGDESGLAEGTLRLTGHLGRARTEPAPGGGDEQPLDASAFVAAELAAFSVTGDPEHAKRAQRSFDWFLGRNRLAPAALRLRDRRLQRRTRRGDANDNQGAESTLAVHSAALLLDAAGLPAVHRTRETATA